MATRPVPDFTRETAAMTGGAGFVVGVDEAGRGPLAGPVVAAAVRLDPARIPQGLADSKVLTAGARDRLYQQLLTLAEVSTGQASVEEIDDLNILRASHLAMVRAVRGLPRADHAIIDGNLVPAGLPCPAQAVVKGDAHCLSVAAASIVAKVLRDRIMVALSQQHPGYGWDRNAGYPTAEHLAALQNLGPTPAHRRSFAPVHKTLYQGKCISL
ncbi:MAG: ribonuclease HII [Paracoccaceae bacterium]|nr:MAG: ribonuclease HII [Paracoccaceae bacterium]